MAFVGKVLRSTYSVRTTNDKNDSRVNVEIFVIFLTSNAIGILETGGSKAAAVSSATTNRARSSG